jgi:hypothetical protein
VKHRTAAILSPAAHRRTRDEREALANLRATREQMKLAWHAAREEGDLLAAQRFRTKYAVYRLALAMIAKGADPLDVHAKVTGSTVFTRR